MADIVCLLVITTTTTSTLSVEKKTEWLVTLMGLFERDWLPPHPLARVFFSHFLLFRFLADTYVKVVKVLEVAKSHVYDYLFSPKDVVFLLICVVLSKLRLEMVHNVKTFYLM